MTLQNRIDKLERAARQATPPGYDVSALTDEELLALRDASPFDMSLLTDAELLALEACFSKALAAGVSVDQYLTPELESVLRRVER